MWFPGFVRCIDAKVLGCAKFQFVVRSMEVARFSEVAFTLSLCKLQSISQGLSTVERQSASMGGSTVYTCTCDLAISLRDSGATPRL